MCDKLHIITVRIVDSFTSDCGKIKSNMKFVLLLVVLIPLAFAAPEERSIHDILSALGKFAHIDEVKSVVQTIVDNIGTDQSESECEAACPNLFHNAIGASVCRVACKGTQQLAQHFHITPTSS